MPATRPQQKSRHRSSRADKSNEWQISHFAIEPDMDAYYRRARELGQTREERIRYRVFGQETEQLRRWNGGDKIGGLDSAPIAQPRARDAAAGSELERLHMRVRYDCAAGALD